MRRLTDRAINAFADWFGSTACVFETLALCAVLAGCEAAWPRVDPHNFKFLYAMTFYSSVTQPALAYAAERLGRRLLELLHGIREAIELLLALAKDWQAVKEALLTQNETLVELVRLERDRQRAAA